MALFVDHHHHRHVQAPAYPQEVHEHRAPTDESIKLLREMEEKARRQIVESMTIDNVFHVTAVKFQHESFDSTAVVYVHYKLNGREYHHKIQGPDARLMHLDKEAAFKTIFERLSQDIAAQLMNVLMSR